MLNDRERQCLASMEEHLRHSDPRLVAGFRSLERARPRRVHPARPRTAHGSTHRSMHGAGPVPCVMLAVAMLLLLAGAATGAMTIVVGGIVMALLTLGVAATSAPRPGPGFA
ncbi:DUF3040 domain-containing protein [Pseudonocardia endophytica]|uniref:DUF3040 family protein n=1 Tax=Pseudonocardia endophytica TaxID=401976 RepID=A0A4R1HZ62_PSEEN|nr:DUF3040 domain-containing protein [Pseudonocardia endophytica]TCK27708.1 DUF3040 family protein [Pseudonocardia endophytica]